MSNTPQHSTAGEGGCTTPQRYTETIQTGGRRGGAAWSGTRAKLPSHEVRRPHKHGPHKHQRPSAGTGNGVTHSSAAVIVFACCVGLVESTAQSHRGALSDLGLTGHAWPPSHVRPAHTAGSQPGATERPASCANLFFSMHQLSAGRQVGDSRDAADRACASGLCCCLNRAEPAWPGCGRQLPGVWVQKHSAAGMQPPQSGPGQPSTAGCWQEHAQVWPVESPLLKERRAS
jgi:hypothetical protein